MNEKQLQGVERGAAGHWVGDGFPVRTLFSYPELGAALDPFLLLDYAGPIEFAPTAERRGVGAHPHRGFETVTVVYAGEVEHRDSSGAGGRIGPGDVQWMTAGAGVVHEEFHGRDFARRGGLFEMVQLWVNLPARDKMAPPRYQHIEDAHIARAPLPGGIGEVRVIAGEFAGVRGPARTFTPVHLWDMRAASGQPFTLTVPEGYSCALVVLRGELRVAGAQSIAAAEVGVFDRRGSAIRIEHAYEATALLLAGEPIEEPIVGRGPFVMNTAAQIHEAIADYHSGRMGRLS